MPNTSHTKKTLADRRREAINRLSDSLSMVNVGYPWYHVPQNIRFALKLLRDMEQKEQDRAEKRRNPMANVVYYRTPR